MKNNLSNTYPVVNLYKKRNVASEVVTQMLLGENFTVIKKFRNWFKIKLDSDGYIGYIKKKKFLKKFKPTHKVSVLSSNIYKKPAYNSMLKKKLTFSSRIFVTEKKGPFVKFYNQWIIENDLKPINYKNKNIFSKVTLFKSKKYKWGGKNFNGLDCSALVQLFFNFNNKYCPRDTKDQLKFFKNRVNLKSIKKNDLIFWKGHVAVATSKNSLIHAYGPFKKVVKIPINKTIERIYKTANLKVIGIRSIS